jgi:hypothetical protein
MRFSLAEAQQRLNALLARRAATALEASTGGTVYWRTATGSFDQLRHGPNLINNVRTPEHR